VRPARAACRPSKVLGPLFALDAALKSRHSSTCAASSGLTKLSSPICMSLLVVVRASQRGAAVQRIARTLPIALPISEDSGL
jgi:hypothetical protein